MSSSAMLLVGLLLSTSNLRGADAQGFEYGDPIDVRREKGQGEGCLLLFVVVVVVMGGVG